MIFKVSDEVALFLYKHSLQLGRGQRAFSVCISGRVLGATHTPVTMGPEETCEHCMQQVSIMCQAWLSAPVEFTLYQRECAVVLSPVFLVAPPALSQGDPGPELRQQPQLLEKGIERGI